MESSPTSSPESIPIPEDGICPVCHEPLDELDEQNPTCAMQKCGHLFHLSCLVEVCKRYDQGRTQCICPMCRQKGSPCRQAMDRMQTFMARPRHTPIPIFRTMDTRRFPLGFRYSDRPFQVSVSLNSLARFFDQGFIPVMPRGFVRVEDVEVFPLD